MILTEGLNQFHSITFEHQLKGLTMNDRREE